MFIFSNSIFFKLPFSGCLQLISKDNPTEIYKFNFASPKNIFKIYKNHRFSELKKPGTEISSRFTFPYLTPISIADLINFRNCS